VRGRWPFAGTLPSVAALLLAGSVAGQPGPIAIEPAQIEVSLVPVSDAGIESGAPDTNYGSTDSLPVYFGGENEIGRALIRFNLAAGLPAEAIID